MRGGGFGHGVGLSQSGAIEMAKLGFSYEQILNHYYRDAKLKKIEILKMRMFKKCSKKKNENCGF